MDLLILLEAHTEIRMSFPTKSEHLLSFLPSYQHRLILRCDICDSNTKQIPKTYSNYQLISPNTEYRVSNTKYTLPNSKSEACFFFKI